MVEFFVAGSVQKASTGSLPVQFPGTLQVAQVAPKKLLLTLSEHCQASSFLQFVDFMPFWVPLARSLGALCPVFIFQPCLAQALGLLKRRLGLMNASASKWNPTWIRSHGCLTLHMGVDQYSV